MQLSSRAVRDPEYKDYNPPHQVPLVAASSFIFDTIEEGMKIFDGEQEGHIYGRFGNPTIDAAAQKIADMETHGGDFSARGLFCSSGMAAIATVFLGLLRSGERVLTSEDLYGGTTGLLQLLSERGIGLDTVDFRADQEEDFKVSRSMLRQQGGIRAIYVETPSNPTLRVTDLQRLAEVAHEHGALLIVDNTFATPMMQQPLRLGADIVVHSTTKYLNGHGTGIAGALVCRDERLFTEHLVPTYRLVGGNGNAWDAWLVLNGLKTLPLRMERHSENAQRVAEWLLAHPRVQQVNYPGLAHHPERAVIDRQMKLTGGMLSFEIEGGLAAGMAFMNRIRFCTLTPTLGDVDTLVLHPASMSHRGIEPDVRRSHGITDGLVRLSVGIEAVEDIIQDLAQALEA